MPEFIGSGSVPGVFEFGVMEELSIFEGLVGLHVNDGVCTVAASGKDAQQCCHWLGAKVCTGVVQCG